MGAPSPGGKVKFVLNDVTKGKVEMSKPIRGDEAVDRSALEQTSTACRFAMENVRQFSVDTLTTLLAKFDETGARLKTVLEWRVKQSVGGEHMSQINEKLRSLTERVSAIETMVKAATAPMEMVASEGATSDKQLGFDWDDSQNPTEPEAQDEAEPVGYEDEKEEAAEERELEE